MQVDVFAVQALSGNPVAVVLDATGRSTADIQRLTIWTNLSETTFVLPGTPGVSDYHLRIFTPHEELPFAGHPTIGTVHAQWAAVGRGQVGLPCSHETAVQFVNFVLRHVNLLKRRCVDTSPTGKRRNQPSLEPPFVVPRRLTRLARKQPGECRLVVVANGNHDFSDGHGAEFQQVLGLFDAGLLQPLKRCHAGFLAVTPKYRT